MLIFIRARLWWFKLDDVCYESYRVTSTSTLLLNRDVAKHSKGKLECNETIKWMLMQQVSHDWTSAIYVKYEIYFFRKKCNWYINLLVGIDSSNTSTCILPALWIVEKVFDALDRKQIIYNLSFSTFFRKIKWQFFSITPSF